MSRQNLYPDWTAADFTDPLFMDARALIVGISDYRDPDIAGVLGRLRQTDDDAKALRETLISIGYSPERITCLCNEEASLEDIRWQLRELDRMARVPLLLLFWAGHGASNAWGRSFLLPYDTDLRRLEDTAIPVDEIILLVRVANATHKTIFLDTCFSAPTSARMFLPDWHHPGLVQADPSLAFVGASTYLALAQAGRGGILAQCLMESLTDRGASLCDDDGVVHLADVMMYLQRYVRPRAVAAWQQAGRLGEGPQKPYIACQPGEPIAVGRNVPRHVRRALDRCELPEPVRKLAAMVLTRPWPWRDAG